MSPDLEPEFEINYSELRNKFKTWLSKYSQKYSKDILSYLDKYISNKIIKNREELSDLINSVRFGKRHLCYSLRVFFNFLEDIRMLDEEILDKLRKIVKIPRTGVDEYIPNDEEILKIYKMINDERYIILYKLLAFSGIRLIEGEELLRNFDKKRL